MSREKYLTLYIFLGLIILIGVLMFVFKDFLATQMSSGVGLSDEVLSRAVEADANSALNLEVLSDKRFTNLKNQIINFDYDNFGKSGSVNDITITNLRPNSSEGAATGSPLVQTTQIRVDIGNNNLFFKDK